MRMGGEGGLLNLEEAYRQDIEPVHPLLIRTDLGTKQTSNGQRQEAFKGLNSFVLRQLVVGNHRGSTGSIRLRPTDVSIYTKQKHSRDHVHNLDADLTQLRECALLRRL